MTLYPPASIETRDAASPSRLDMDGTAWGTCEIRLVADRVASLHTGSTHKVYRGWRFEAATPAGHAEPGSTLLTIPVDPTHLAASQSRYALVQLANQGVIADGEPAAFSWTASSIGTADPFAEALQQVHRHLHAAGWTQDATVPMRYAKTDPSAHVSHQFPTAMTSPPAVVGLDRWETDGGTGRTVLAHSPAPWPG